MKIRAYPLLRQEGHTPRAGEKNVSMPAAGRSLSVPKEEECFGGQQVNEAMRTRLRACLAQAHQAQAELSSLQGLEKHLADAEKLYRELEQMLPPQDNGEQSVNMELLHRGLGKVRDLLAKLNPEFSDASHNREESTPGEPVPLLEQLNTELETARKKLTARQRELIQAIAESLVATENVAASSSAIRDGLNARQVLDELKDKLKSEAQNLSPSLLSRPNIAELLR